MNTVKNGKGSKSRIKNKVQFDLNWNLINWKKDTNGHTEPANGKRIVSKSLREPNK